MLATAIPEGLGIWWWSALGAGLAVAAVLVALLSWLYKVVLDIEKGLGDIWKTGKDVARNTATTWMLRETGRLLEDFQKEALAHDRILREKGG